MPQSSLLEQAPDLIACVNLNIAKEDKVFIFGNSIMASEFGMDMSEHWNGVHALNGIIILSGNHSEKGKRIQRASILDVAPTILALFDLPVGADMDGRILVEAIDEEYLEKNPVTYIESYDLLNIRKVIEYPITQAEDKKLIEKLRSIGYIN